MKQVSHSVILLLLSGSAVIPTKAAETPASPVTLHVCYEWAVARSEDLRIREEDVTRARLRGRAALGTAFPRLSWRLDSTWQDPNGVDELEAKGFSGFVEKNQVESKFSLEQPIFSGLREISAWKGFQREQKRDTYRLARAKFDLFQQVSEAFYVVVAYETNYKNIATTLDLAQGRVKELQDFLRLGKARESELFTAKARAASLKGRLDEAQANVGSARENLIYLIAHELPPQPLMDEIPDAPAHGTLEEALAYARDRTDLKAQEEEMAALRLRVRYEKGSYWPSIDATGHYYTQRATFLDAIDWDVLLSVEAPIYQGGTVSAQVKDAKAAYRQAAFLYEQMERQVFSSVRKTYRELSATAEETKSQREAADAAQKSYDALRKEYRNGLVTNLDVLEALDFLQDQKTSYDSARLREKLLFLRLKAATEQIP